MVNALALAEKILAEAKEPSAAWTKDQWDAYWKQNPCTVVTCDKPVIVLKWHNIARHGAQE